MLWLSKCFCNTDQDTNSTRLIFRNPTDASNKFDLSILHPKFDSIFPQIGFPVNTYAYSGAETEGQTDIRYPVSAVGSFGNQASNKLPKMFVSISFYIYINNFLMF